MGRRSSPHWWVVRMPILHFSDKLNAFVARNSALQGQKSNSHAYVAAMSIIWSSCNFSCCCNQAPIQAQPAIPCELQSLVLGRQQNALSSVRGKEKKITKESRMNEAKLEIDKERNPGDAVHGISVASAIATIVGGTSHYGRGSRGQRNLAIRLVP